MSEASATAAKPTTSASKIPDNQASNELTQAVDELLEHIKLKFSAISEEMLTKMDEMSRRLDNLEASLRSDEDSNVHSER